MNREALDAIRLGAADGLEATGEAIIAVATPRAPDAAPFGKGLVGGGSVVTFVDRRKVASFGPLSRIPRSGRVPPVGTVAVFGFSFPGRFKETGTIHSPAEPFLTPSTAETIPGAGDFVAGRIAAKLKTVRS
jgi:hypothetical protein